jgi:hypothetical protein
MVVASVDQRDLDRTTLDGMNKLQAGEACADNNQPMFVHVFVGRRQAHLVGDIRFVDMPTFRQRAFDAFTAIFADEADLLVQQCCHLEFLRFA